MFHSSPRADLDPIISLERSLCLADDRNIAEMYRRGGDAQHYLYEAEWASANLAGETDLAQIVGSLGLSVEDDFDCQPHLAMKSQKVRRALLAAGYEGACYEDTHEGCNYETVELLSRPEGFVLRRIA